MGTNWLNVTVGGTVEYLIIGGGGGGGGAGVYRCSVQAEPSGSNSPHQQYNGKSAGGLYKIATYKIATK